jgi:hypothetical protein
MSRLDMLEEGNSQEGKAKSRMAMKDGKEGESADATLATLPTPRGWTLEPREHVQRRHHAGCMWTSCDDGWAESSPTSGG